MPWRSYDRSSLVANAIASLGYNIPKYNGLDETTKRLFFAYITLLSVHAVILCRIAKSSAYDTWRNPLMAISRLAGTAVCLCALEGWTTPSQHCTADLARYVLFRHGILTQIFLTFYFPLPGLYHQAVHILTTIWAVRNCSKVCSLLLNSPDDSCGYRTWLLSALWPKVCAVGQALAGILYAQIDPEPLRSLGAYGKCHVSMVWLQLCLGYLLPCLLQYAFGFDDSMRGYLDELPDPNRYCVFLALIMIILGLFWRVSYTWGLWLMSSTNTCALNDTCIY